MEYYIIYINIEFWVSVYQIAVPSGPQGIIYIYQPQPISNFKVTSIHKESASFHTLLAENKTEHKNKSRKVWMLFFPLFISQLLSSIKGVIWQDNNTCVIYQKLQQ